MAIQEQRHLLKFDSERSGRLPSLLTIIDGSNGNSYSIRRGETTFIGGASAVTNGLLHSAVFRSLVTSDGIVLWIDGGNSFDPYRISELAERCGYDARELLSRIRIARAFTAHQMESITRSAAKEAGKFRISMLVVSSVAELFTGDVGWMEGMDLLRSSVNNLRKLTEDCFIWSLMTSDVSVSSSTEMESIIDESYERIIHVGLENRNLQVESDGLLLTVSRWNEKKHQRSLLEFAGND